MKIHKLLIYSLLAGGLSACSVQGSEPQDQDQEADRQEELELVQMVGTDAGDSLQMDVMVETHFVRMPDTPMGYRAQALLEVLRSDDDEQILPFVYEHYDPDFLAQVPQSDHKALIRKLQQQIEQPEVSGVESLQDEYRIELQSQDSRQKWVLDIYFQPEAPYKISGVRVL